MQEFNLIQTNEENLIEMVYDNKKYKYNLIDKNSFSFRIQAEVLKYSNGNKLQYELFFSLGEEKLELDKIMNNGKRKRLTNSLMALSQIFPNFDIYYQPYRGVISDGDFFSLVPMFKLFNLIECEDNKGMYYFAFFILGSMGGESVYNFGRTLQRLITIFPSFEILYKSNIIGWNKFDNFYLDSDSKEIKNRNIISKLYNEEFNVKYLFENSGLEISSINNFLHMDKNTFVKEDNDKEKELYNKEIKVNNNFIQEIVRDLDSYYPRGINCAYRKFNNLRRILNGSDYSTFLEIERLYLEIAKEVGSDIDRTPSNWAINLLKNNPINLDSKELVILKNKKSYKLKDFLEFNLYEFKKIYLQAMLDSIKDGKFKYKLEVKYGDYEGQVSLRLANRSILYQTFNTDELFEVMQILHNKDYKEMVYDYFYTIFTTSTRNGRISNRYLDDILGLHRDIFVNSVVKKESFISDVPENSDMLMNLSGTNTRLENLSIIINRINNFNNLDKDGKDELIGFLKYIFSNQSYNYKIPSDRALFIFLYAFDRIPQVFTTECKKEVRRLKSVIDIKLDSLTFIHDSLVNTLNNLKTATKEISLDKNYTSMLFTKLTDNISKKIIKDSIIEYYNEVKEDYGSMENFVSSELNLLAINDLIEVDNEKEEINLLGKSKEIYEFFGSVPIRKRILNKYIEETYNKGLRKVNYEIVIPEYTSDLMVEGKSLRNCVMTYIPYVRRESSFVCFIRNKDDLKEPLYTIEIEDGKIIQISGKNDKIPSVSVLKTINNFIKISLKVADIDI